jgi:small subunit ribosomal protein S4e
MVKNHLKRIAAPRTWPLLRKEDVFVMRPNPGKVMQLSLPLGFVLKELLHVAQTSMQVKKILAQGVVSIDGIMIKELRYPLGLYQVLTLDKKSYRLSLSTKGSLALIPLASAEDKTLVRIISKKVLAKGVLSYGMLNGRTIRAAAKSKSYQVGDSLVMSLKGDVLEHLPFGKGKLVQFIGGRHIGFVGHVQHIDAQVLQVTLADGTTVETLKKYAFVVGDKKSAVTLA